MFTCRVRVVSIHRYSIVLANLNITRIIIMSKLLEISSIKTMQNRTERDEHKTRLMENSFTKP